MSNILKKLFSFILFLQLITLLYLISFADSTEVIQKIDEWQKTFLTIVKSLVKFGGIISLTGVCIFIYFNNDEISAKRAKQTFFIVFLITLLAWFSDLIIKIFLN